VESGFRGRETVERGEPKVGQSGRFLHVLVFWRLFPTSCRREGHKTAVFGVFEFFPAREREKEEEEREYGWIKVEPTVQMESEWKVGQLFFFVVLHFLLF